MPNPLTKNHPRWRAAIMDGYSWHGTTLRPEYTHRYRAASTGLDMLNRL